MTSVSDFHGCAYDQPARPNRERWLAEVATAFSILKPTPAPCELIHVGSSEDGGYLLPADLQGIAGCFSPGVNNRKDFEDELCRTFAIPCHMCDFSSDPDQFKTPLIPGLQTFEQVWLDLEGRPDSVSLAGWVENHAGGVTDDLLLQIDIEGAEYRNILATPSDVLARFRVIVLELHDLRSAFHDEGIMRNVLLPFLRKLDESFLSIHVHPNNYTDEFLLPELGANMADVIEVTFLRRDRFPEHDGNGRFPVMLPHPLDIPANTWRRPPVFLNAQWFDGQRPRKSKIRMVKDEVRFLRRQIAVLIDAAKASITMIRRSGRRL